MTNLAAIVLDTENTGAIHEIVAYHADDAGQTFLTAVLDNGDVIDADALDVFLVPDSHPLVAAA